MEDYFQEALQQLYICPTTYPASERRGLLSLHGLSQALSQITVKYQYPLPLIPSTLEQLHMTIQAIHQA